MAGHASVWCGRDKPLEIKPSWVRTIVSQVIASQAIMGQPIAGHLVTSQPIAGQLLLVEPSKVR